MNCGIYDSEDTQNREYVWQHAHNQPGLYDCMQICLSYECSLYLALFQWSHTSATGHLIFAIHFWIEDQKPQIVYFLFSLFFFFFFLFTCIQQMNGCEPPIMGYRRNDIELHSLISVLVKAQVTDTEILLQWLDNPIWSANMTCPD